MQQTFNDTQYINLIRKLGFYPVHIGNISNEIINYSGVFYPSGQLQCADESYVQSELDWYMSKDLSIDSNERISKTKIWNQICSDNRTVNSNYGWCIFSEENGNQFESCVKHLQHDKYTRHASMIYSRPSIHSEWNDNEHAKSDMICTVYVQVMYRYDRLQYIVHMRSNDVWFGLRNDLAWHMKILNMLSDRLGMKPGNIFWNADSIHIYEWAKPIIIKKITEVYGETIRL